MPRHSRDFFVSDFLHVMVQGDEKKFIFKSNVQKEKFLSLMYYSAFYNNVEIIAYCIMGNHAHILVYSREIENVSKMLHLMNTKYGMYYNKTKNIVGHVFRDRFKSENINSHSYLINCIKYIHQNPVEAGICQKCKDYSYSSYHDFEMSKKEYLLDGSYFTNEDLLEIVEDGAVDDIFMDDTEKEDLELVFQEIKKHFSIDSIAENDIVFIYQELKNRCCVSDDKIALMLNINRSKLRKILVKAKIKQ